MHKWLALLLSSLFPLYIIEHIVFTDMTFYRVHARLLHPLRGDPHRQEFHRAVIRWVPDDGSGRPG